MGPEPATAGRHSLEMASLGPRTAPWYMPSPLEASVLVLAPLTTFPSNYAGRGSWWGRGEGWEWPTGMAGMALTLRERKTASGGKRPGMSG